MSGGYFLPLDTGLQPLDQSIPVDKFTIPVHPSDEPGTPCHTRKQESYRKHQIKSHVKRTPGT